jgi:hypothetical protein
MTTQTSGSSVPQLPERDVERKDAAHFSPEDHGAEHAGLTPETPRSAINPVGGRTDHPG